MKKIAFVLAIFGVLTRAAVAESTLGKLAHGIDVVKGCSGDVRQYCHGITPGDGRIKACMVGHLAELSRCRMEAADFA